VRAGRNPRRLSIDPRRHQKTYQERGREAVTSYSLAEHRATKRERERIAALTPGAVEMQ